MNSRVFVSSGLVVVSLASLWGVWAQHQQLVGLRTEQQRVVAGQASSETQTNEAPSPDSLAATPELLKLRSEVTRLTERRRELASAATEHRRLQAQLASRGTNVGMRFSPGYIRKTEARQVGYGTPEDTVQSFLWALQNHDFTNFLQALAPEAVPDIQSGRSPEVLFRETDGLIGMRIVARRLLDDGTMEAEVEVLPDMPPQRVLFRQIGGQWKIAAPF